MDLASWYCAPGSPRSAREARSAGRDSSVCGNCGRAKRRCGCTTSSPKEKRSEKFEIARAIPKFMMVPLVAGHTITFTRRATVPEEKKWHTLSPHAKCVMSQSVPLAWRIGRCVDECGWLKVPSVSEKIRERAFHPVRPRGAAVGW